MRSSKKLLTLLLMSMFVLNLFMPVYAFEKETLKQQLILVNKKLVKARKAKNSVAVEALVKQKKELLENWFTLRKELDAAK